MAITLFIYLLSLACWLGGMVFFSILTAPVIFAVLPLAEAGKVVSGVFPRYYMLGYAAGLIGFILALYFAISHPPRLWWSLAAAALLIALLLTLYAGAVVRPRAEAIRAVAEEQNPDPARKAEFQHLHHVSVNVNGAVMVLNVIAMLSTAAALAPHG